MNVRFFYVSPWVSSCRNHLLNCVTIREQQLKFLLEHEIIPVEQHGFVPNRSVVTNLLSCLNDWSRELDNDNPVDVIYFDYIKAFDEVPTNSLLHKLEHFGVRGGWLKWIEGFLSFRTFRVNIDGCLSNSHKVLSGVPQGTIFGPLTIRSLYRRSYRRTFQSFRSIRWRLKIV